jgi:hypothetical protein
LVVSDDPAGVLIRDLLASELLRRQDLAEAAWRPQDDGLTFRADRRTVVACLGGR